jgi:hypothetical protein
VSIRFERDPDAGLFINAAQARQGNWWEISNNTGETISTKGMYMTDDTDRPMRWAMPSLLIRPGEVLFIPAASNTENGDRLKRSQANFGITFGERLCLVDAHGEIVQRVEVTLMDPEDVQYRRPDGNWTVESRTNWMQYNTRQSIGQRKRT